MLDVPVSGVQEMCVNIHATTVIKKLHIEIKGNTFSQCKSFWEDYEF